MNRFMFITIRNLNQRDGAIQVINLPKKTEAISKISGCWWEIVMALFVTDLYPFLILKIGTINLYKKLFAHLKSSRSTLEFASQPFRSLSVLYSPDFGLIKQTLIRTSRCNKVDTVRLYASQRCRFSFIKGAEGVSVKV